MGEPVQAADPDGDTLSYSLAGDDVESFAINESTGQLLTRTVLDIDNYSVSVSVSDSKDDDGDPDGAIDDSIDVSISVVRVSVPARPTALLTSIPRQFVPINGGTRRITLSDYFSDPDEGHPPYQATTSDPAIAAAGVSNDYLDLTPVGTGVATTTLTVSDTPGIRQLFDVIVYRPVIPRTDYESVYLVDPEVETTLTSNDGSLTVTLPAGTQDSWAQAAIDALSEDCGTQSPVDEDRFCVVVDLFDIDAQPVEEDLGHAASLYVSLDKDEFEAVRADINGGNFTMWRGNGAAEPSWVVIPPCDDPPGDAECFSLIENDDDTGGRITVSNVMRFSQFTGGTNPPAQKPEPPPDVTPPPSTGGGSGGNQGGTGTTGTRSRLDTYEDRGNETPQIFGQTAISYPENGTHIVAEFTVRDPDDDEITWSLLGHDRKTFELSNEGVLNFRSPPDYENPMGWKDNTYWVIVMAEDDGKPSEYDVHNVQVTVTQVNELGIISGDSEALVPEHQAGVLARYRIEDPEQGVIAWSLSGPDAMEFRIDSDGNVLPTGDLDYENPRNSNSDNVYELTVTATDDGKPVLSDQTNVTYRVVDVNESPLVGAIPAIDLTAGNPPLRVDLGLYFTDPDGDPLTYAFSDDVDPEVVSVEQDDSALSISPMGDGTTTIHVTASDPSGLSANGSVDVTVTVPAVTTVQAGAGQSDIRENQTPDPFPISTITWEPEQTDVASSREPEETNVPSPVYVPLSERRYRNLAQEPDKVSKLVVTFTITPVDAPHREDVMLAELARTETPDKVVPSNAMPPGQPQTPIALTSGEGGEGLSVWVVMLMILLVMATVGFTVYMVVTHRMSRWRAVRV